MEPRMIDPKLRMLEELALIDPDDDERVSYSPKAARELTEAHEVQRRIDAMGEGVAENETAEDVAEEPEDPTADLRAQVGRLRTSNIELQGKLVVVQTELARLKGLMTKLQAAHPELIEELL